VRSFPVTVRYRFSEGGDTDTAASFRGRFFDRSDAAVFNRLRELHRFAARVEIDELRWEDTRPDGVEPSRGSATICGTPDRQGRQREGMLRRAPATAREPAC